MKRSGREERPGAYAPPQRRPEHSEDTPRAETNKSGSVAT